jgi:hypothetical protein
MIMMPYGRCRSSLQLTGTQTSGTPQDAGRSAQPDRLADRTADPARQLNLPAHETSRLALRPAAAAPMT